VSKAHESVALPEPVTLVGANTQAVLLLVKPTMPLNPFCGVMVIVDVPGLPALTVTVVGIALVEKSSIEKVTLAECERPPLEPVTATRMFVGELNEHERVEMPEPVMLAGDRVHPVLLLLRPTTPAKPFSPVKVIVDVTEDPAFPVTLVGLALIAKS